MWKKWVEDWLKFDIETKILNIRLRSSPLNKGTETKFESVSIIK